MPRSENQQPDSFRSAPEIESPIESTAVQSLDELMQDQLQIQRARENRAPFAPSSPTPAHPHKVATFYGTTPQQLACTPRALEVIPARCGDCIPHANFLYEETGAFIAKDGTVYLRCHQPNPRAALDDCQSVLSQLFDWPRKAPAYPVHAIVDWNTPGPFKNVEVKRKWTPANNGVQGTDYYYRIRPRGRIA